MTHRHPAYSRFPIHITAGRERRPLCGNAAPNAPRLADLRSRTIRPLFCLDCARLADANRNNLIAALNR